MRAVLLLSLILASSPAYALSCFEGPEPLIPAVNATDVPRNAVVRIKASPFGGPFTYALRVGDGAGPDVPITWETEPGLDEDVVTLRPVDLLTPFTTYVVVERWVHEDVEDTDDGLGDTDDGVGDTDLEPADDRWEVVQFTTGDVVDDTAPDAPEVLRAGKRRSPGWFPFFGASAALRVVVTRPAEPVAYRLRIEEAGTGRITRLWSGASPIDDDRDAIRVGEGMCDSTYDVTARPVRVTVEAVDQAGLVAAEAGGPAMTGCRTTPGVPAVWLALLGGMVGRRRRR